MDYYFLKQYARGGTHHNYCTVCFEAVSSGAVPAEQSVRDASAPEARDLPRPPQRIPIVMIIFAGLGGLMMLLGLGFTMMSTGDDANVTHILFGAITTALGFVLVRKTLKSRSLLLGQARLRA